MKKSAVVMGVLALALTGCSSQVDAGEWCESHAGSGHAYADAASAGERTTDSEINSLLGDLADAHSDRESGEDIGTLDLDIELDIYSHCALEYGI